MKVIVVLPAYACDAVKRHIQDKFPEAKKATFRDKAVLADSTRAMQLAVEISEPVLILIAERLDEWRENDYWLGTRFAATLAKKKQNAFVILLAERMPMPSTGICAILPGGLSKVLHVLKVKFETMTTWKEVISALRPYVTEVT